MLGPGLPRDEKAGLLIGPLVLGQVGAVSGSILARGRRCVLFIVIFIPWLLDNENPIFIDYSPLEPVSKASMVPVAAYSSLRRKPESRCRLVDG